MSHGFYTLKEKVQYLLDKMDAGEKILSVEMDLLKAYCDALSKEIEQNGEELIKEFPLKPKTEEIQERPMVEETLDTLSSKEEIEDDMEQEVEEEGHIEEASESSYESDVKEEIHNESESESDEPKQVVEETIDEAEHEPANEAEEKTVVESGTNVSDEDYFEVTITNDEDEEVSNEAEVISTNKEEQHEPVAEAKSEVLEVEESVEEPLRNQEPEKEENYQFAHTREATQIKRDSSPKEENEDYGIGLKFKQSKPLGELIDLSEKYVFIQGLFNQDPDRFTKALRRMDEAISMDEALKILDDYVVEKDADLLQKLKAYLRIRFS